MAVKESSTAERYGGIDNLEVMEEAKNYNAFLVAIAASYSPKHGLTLDFGAGTGTIALPLMRQGIDVTCIEPDSRLRQHLESERLRVLPDIAEIGSDSIDYVYSFNVLEHIEDDRSAANALHRILKPGGRLLAYVPAFQLLYNSMDQRIGHWRRYRRAGLVGLVEDAGFFIERSEYVDCIGFFAALAYKLLDRGSGDLNVAAVRLFDRFLLPISRVLDRASARSFGKNLLVVASKSPNPEGSGD